MKHKKPTKTMFQMLELVRRIGIRSHVLPRNFPKSENIIFRFVEDKELDFAGMGGAMPDKAGKLEPFFVVNLAHNLTAQYFMSTIAHELLHIKQFRKNGEVSHNNAFRRDCRIFANSLGCDYYLLYGYDAPSEKTAKAKGAKVEKWYNGFRGKQKGKNYQDCPNL